MPKCRKPIGVTVGAGDIEAIGIVAGMFAVGTRATTTGDIMAAVIRTTATGAAQASTSISGVAGVGGNVTRTTRHAYGVPGPRIGRRPKAPGGDHSTFNKPGSCFSAPRHCRVRQYANKR
jgi:hypothetical protein